MLERIEIYEERGRLVFDFHHMREGQDHWRHLVGVEGAKVDDAPKHFAAAFEAAVDIVREELEAADVGG